LIKGGSSTVTLTGNLASLTGGLALNAGTLNLAPTGNFTYSAGITGSGTLGKSGTATLTLSGTNTLTGPTNVNAGKLIVEGSMTGSLFTVQSGATLGGHGTVGAVSLNGTIAPGDSPGTLTTGNETWNAGGSYQWQLNDASDAAGAKGSSYDWLSINGTLTLGSTSATPFVLQLQSLTAGNVAGITPNFAPGTTYNWTIVTANSISGFSPTEFTIDASGFVNDPNSADFALAQVGNNLVLQYTTVPEPGTGACLLLGLSFLAATSRRRHATKRGERA
jgi:autotransporter-associated beta strand protein